MNKINNRLFDFSLLALLAGALLPALVAAQTPEVEDWNVKLQVTYVWQHKPALAAAYSGPRSLSTARENGYSFTATAALGFRPWSGGEFYFDPEATQGSPLGGLSGLGGFTNGENQRTAGPMLKFYRARLFVRQTWGVGGGKEAVESDANQLAGSIDKQRVVLTVGTVSVLDLFDDNAYSHDPRTQFLNWSFMTHGAYDYAADARGYTSGLTLEYFGAGWAARAGRYIQPKQPNQLQLDWRIFSHYGDQIEVEHAHALGEQPGRLRLLAFRNRAVMSSFRDALDLAAQTGDTPDINAVRSGEKTKRGIGVNLEQSLTANVGLVTRAMWADGQTETYAFTEIDRSFSAGTLIKGASWGRGQDSVGIAIARNGLSQAHRDYLSAGGLGFFIGDGQLNYRPETILEAFYSLGVIKGSWFSLDAQRIQNPAYNADRGPIKVFSIRLHIEY
jgi:hypothetical protein